MSKQSIKIGLFGFGTVGQGVYKVLGQTKTHMPKYVAYACAT